MPVAKEDAIDSRSLMAARQTIGRMRLDYLDGLRGSAAFYVMLSHVSNFAAATNAATVATLSRPLSLLVGGLQYGREAVAVFIVLSGFCLMLPVAGSTDAMLSGGLVGFARRRARRILPPYYAALTLSIAVAVLSLHFHQYGNDRKPDVSGGNLASHVFLVHNLFADYVRSLDPPMWSVAAEWQIYVLFALVLLPVWRRFGLPWVMFLAFGIPAAMVEFLPEGSNLYWTCPWYLGLFALGMAAAVAMCSPHDEYRLFKSRAFQNTAMMALAAGTMIYGNIFRWMTTDLLLGPLTAIFILACGNKTDRSWLFAKIAGCLESRPLMVLGAFSYSLYLIHFLLLGKMHGVLYRQHFSYFGEFAILLCVGIPLTLILSYLFHLLFERPFMPGRPRTERGAEIAAIRSPAP